MKLSVKKNSPEMIAPPPNRIFHKYVKYYTDFLSGHIWKKWDKIHRRHDPTPPPPNLDTRGTWLFSWKIFFKVRYETNRIFDFEEISMKKRSISRTTSYYLGTSGVSLIESTPLIGGSRVGGWVRGSEPSFLWDTRIF